MTASHLPVDDVLPQLVDALRSGSAVVLRAATGAGKTTRVAPALLDAGLIDNRQILLLQPRRLAARAAAYRMAEERGCPVGGQVGYHFRYERNTTQKTRIVCMTEGILIRMLQTDPLLEHVGIVIFDEFHERSLDSDLALAMVRRVQTEVRPELKIVVMSATLDVGPVAWYLGDCPVIESQGRTYPVEVEYLPFSTREPVHQLAAAGVAQLLDRTAGHILVFLPGIAEIRRAESAVKSLACSHDVPVLQLYGDLPIERQHAVLAPGGRRKIVLATNVAETSVTIPGVTAVIDSGFARIMRFDAAHGLNRLQVVRIASASADQRAGRAGRTAPGVCLRLWTEREQHGLADHETPEIHRLDLLGVALELLCWGESDLARFPWFDAPPEASVHRAIGLLRQLGALDGSRLSRLGHDMVRLPLHPRLARLVLEGARLGCLNHAALGAALLSERDPFRFDNRDLRKHPRRSDSDILDRITALEEFQRAGRHEFEMGTLNVGAAKMILRARDQIARLVRAQAMPGLSDEQQQHKVLQAMLAAFPERVARRRETGSRRALMVGGRGVRLDERSAVTEAELFVCVELEETGTAEAIVRQASAIDRSWLAKDQVHSSTEVTFDVERQRLVAMRRTRFLDLVIDESSTSVPPDVDARAVLAAEAAARLNLLELLDDASKAFAARVNSLREWMPELEFRTIDQQSLQQILPDWCSGCSSFSELKKVPTLGLLKSLLTAPQIQAVERHAPERLQVPSGNHIALHYEPGKRPVLAVRIQEVFGLQQTPRIAAGRVAVVLHLLGPNMRPQQVTDDLESFWKNTYPQVRKDLRRRYPKHAWPEDPQTAIAERRPNRKG